jgi:hypothetical protein
MKKGLLLSIVASTMIFAGGDIAPVEPAAAAPAADCSDFYGSVGAYYQTFDIEVTDGTTTVENDGFFDKSSSNFNVTAVIGVEKTLFGGIGFGAEVAGWSRISNDIAMANRTESGKEDGELSQLYLTASFGNTAVKFGRFAIPGSLSPLLRTGTTAGVKGITYDGLLIANTDLADTTIYGVWAYRAGTHSTFTKIGADETGAFALGFQNKSIANTTITAVGYYGPDFFTNGTKWNDAMGAALTVNSKFGAYGVDAQITYVDGAIDAAGAELDATMTAALKVNGSFDMFDAWAMVSYVNDGANPSTLAGGSGSLLGDNIDHTAGEGFGVGGGLSAKVWTGKAYLNGGYVSYEDKAGVTDKTHAFAAVGYKFKVSGINFKAEYKYAKDEFTVAPTTYEVTAQRIRLEAAYKF